MAKKHDNGPPPSIPTEHFTVSDAYYRLAMNYGREVRCRCGFTIYDAEIYAHSDHKKNPHWVWYYCAACMPDELKRWILP